ncbi:MAG TPA: helix-turn-helix domain-containing protein [Firmicutes bacterium]|nr:helix-turn-helix domain-containing protein [Bacillota bacterium]
MKYEIGTRIRKFRERQGLSQKEFAKLIGVSNARVSNWEQGLNRPDVDILASICNVLRVDPNELLDIRLNKDGLSEEEKQIISQYRKKPELQHAVRVLLGIDKV